MQVATGDPRRLALESLVEAAQAETGLSDFGEPDLFPGLRALLDAYVTEAQFSATGIEAQRAGLIRVLSNRLRIEALIQQHPEILDEEILGPIIITGLPRSGTTKLLRVLAADSRLQTLLLWKILNPAPFGPVAPGETDPRITFAEQTSAAMRDHFPDFYAGHPMNAHEPDEEEWLLDFVMRGYVNCHSAHIPSFEAWMDRQDFSTWYVYLRKVLQVLQWQDGSPKKTWLLKAPSHMNRLNWLFPVFPDATIVQCHRDPVTALISLSGLSEAIRKMYSDAETPKESAHFVVHHWTKQLEGYMRLRPEYEQEHPFVDVSYPELVNDVEAVIERIYAAAGLPLTPAAKAAILAWERDNPQGKHGKHRYDISRYDISAEQIRALCGSYLARFGELI